MKKLIFSLFAVLAVLASCTSEDYESTGTQQTKSYKFGFTVTPRVDQSRALKGEWESGDVVYYCFKGITDGVLKMVYKNGEWKSYVTSNNLSNANGDMLTGDELSTAMNEFAKKVAENPDKHYKAIWVRGEHTLTWVGKSDKSEGYWAIGNRGCEYWESAEDDLEYKLESDEIDPTVGIIIPVDNYSWKMGNFTKISVYNLPEGHWTLYSPNMNPLMKQGIDPINLKTVKESADVNGRYMPVSTEKDGLVTYGAFYGTPDGGANTTLYLTNGTDTYVKKYNKSLPAAVKISSGLSGFTKIDEEINGHKYVDLGFMRKDIDPSSSSLKRIVIGECNIGADSETGYGLYFRWGEQIGWDLTLNNSGSAITSAKAIDKDGNQTSAVFNSSDAFLYGKTTSEFCGKINQTDGDLTYGDAAQYYWGGNWQMENLLSLLKDFKFKSDGDELKLTIGEVNITVTWYANYNESGVAGFELKNDITWRKAFLPASGFFHCAGNGLNVDGDATSKQLFSMLAGLGNRNIGAAYWSGKPSEDNKYAFSSLFAKVDIPVMNLNKVIAACTSVMYGYSYRDITIDSKIQINMPKSTLCPVRAFAEIDM